MPKRTERSSAACEVQQIFKDRNNSINQHPDLNLSAPNCHKLTQVTRHSIPPTQKWMVDVHFFIKRGGFWGTSCQSAKKPAIYSTRCLLWVQFDVCNCCQVFFRVCAMRWMLLAVCRICVTHERLLQHYRVCARHHCQWRRGGTHDSHTNRPQWRRRMWTEVVWHHGQ